MASNRELAQIPILQQQGELPAGGVQGYLLSPRIPPRLLSECQQYQIHAIEYAPSRVLQHFYTDFQQHLRFNHLTTHNHGVWHLGVTNPIIQALATVSMQEIDDIAAQTELAPSTVKSYLTLLEQLGLVKREGTFYSLTDIGRRYAETMIPHSRSLSEGQAEVLREFITRNPFASGVTLGIFTVVECMASLAKNQYPVPLAILSDYFTFAVGNETRWNKPKTRHDATRMYVEYAAQLGLLARIGDRVYLTPTGAQFTLVLQLHKSIHLVAPLMRG